MRIPGTTEAEVKAGPLSVKICIFCIQILSVGQNLYILYITGHLYDLDGYEK